MTVLLDANVLIALLVEDHVHHGATENRLVGMGGNFATCPITQGSLIRLLIHERPAGQLAPRAQLRVSGNWQRVSRPTWRGIRPATAAGLPPPGQPVQRGSSRTTEALVPSGRTVMARVPRRPSSRAHLPDPISQIPRVATRKPMVGPPSQHGFRGAL